MRCTTKLLSKWSKEQGRYIKLIVKSCFSITFSNTTGCDHKTAYVHASLLAPHLRGSQGSPPPDGGGANGTRFDSLEIS